MLAIRWAVTERFRAMRSRLERTSVGAVVCNPVYQELFELWMEEDVTVARHLTE